MPWHASQISMGSLSLARFPEQWNLNGVGTRSEQALQAAQHSNALQFGHAKDQFAISQKFSINATCPHSASVSSFKNALPVTPRVPPVPSLLGERGLDSPGHFNRQAGPSLFLIAIMPCVVGNYHNTGQAEGRLVWVFGGSLVRVFRITD